MINDSVVGNDGDGRDSNPSDPGDWCSAEEKNNSSHPCYDSLCAPNCTTNEKSTWHGLHVTGTIGASSNNSEGVSGVDWNCKILPVRVLGKGGGYSTDIVDAIIWASGGNVSGVPINPNPAKIINMSLAGYGSCPSSVQDAINYAVSQGVSIVVAAGNSDSNVSNYWPCNCNGVICVAAVKRNGDKAYYSNYGSNVFISAPGGDPSGYIWSTLNSGSTTPIPSPSGDIYAEYQGTSMATPHVSGIISLMLGLKPSLTIDEIKYNLVKTAKPFLSTFTCNTDICGAGIIDAYSALDNLLISISSSTPSSASNTGNISVSIWGKGFIHGASVKLKRTGFQDVICQGVNVVNLNQINCVLPLDGVSSGKWALFVENIDGSFATLSDYFTVTSFYISSITPSTSYNNLDVNVNISGSDFVNPFSVKLTKNGYKDITSINNNFISSTSVSFTLPLNGEFNGKRDLVFINGDGRILTLTDAFEILNATLSVSSISPSFAYNDLSSFNIDFYGTGFTKSGMTAKLIKHGYNDISCNLNIISSTYGVCNLNLIGEFDGRRDFFLSSPYSFITKTDFFEILNTTPSIISVNPTSVYNNSEYNLDIYGKGFRNQSYSIKLYQTGYSDISAISYTVIRSTYIKAIFNLDGVLAGTRNLSIDNIYKLNAINIVDSLTPPYISLISPTYGYNDKDPVINIYGNYFAPSIQIKVLKNIYEISVESFTITSSTSIVSVVLPLKGKEPGIWTVRVVNPDGKHSDYYGFNLLKFEENIKIISPIIDKSNSSSIIKYKTENSQNVTIKVYDARGKYIRTIYSGNSQAGINEVVWDGMDENGRKAKTGVYVIEIKTPSYTDYKRVVVVR